MVTTRCPQLGFTALHIRMHINKIDVHEMFATRDVLVYGTRAAVDMALSRMVKKGAIIRLTNGVFMKVCPEVKLEMPTALQVAQTKARAFGKKIFEHGASLAKRLGLPVSEHLQPTFITDGPPTSFRYGQNRIYFKTAAPRKVNLIELAQGSLINALWHTGQRRINWSNLPSATLYLGRKERHQLRDSIHFMPTWLTRFFSPLPKTA